MKPRNILEEQITEAVDGLLDATRLRQLEIDLADHPDLLEELRTQQMGTGIAQAYESVQPSLFAVTRLRNRLRQAEADQWQYDVIRIFKRYVLASGIGVILMAAALNALPSVSSTTSSDTSITDELGAIFDTIEEDALSWSFPNDTDTEDTP